MFRPTITSLLLAFALLVGCGYQPVRTPVDAALQPVYIRENSDLAIAIKRELLANGVDVTGNPGTANSSIIIQEYDTESRGASVNREGRDAENLHQLYATLLWQKKGGALLLQRDLDVEAIQVSNPDRPLAERNESIMIFEDLAEAMAAQVIRLLRQGGEANQAEPAIQASGAVQ